MSHVQPPRAPLDSTRAIRRLSLLVVQLSLLTLPSFAQQTGASIAPSNAGNMVLMTVTVTDGRGRFVTGIGKEQFTVYDDKATREISFFGNNDEPLSVGFIFDVSGSMRKARIPAAQLGVGRFIQMSHAENEYFISEFSKSARGLTDWTRDADQLLEGLRQVGENDAGGNTALYDACITALAKLAQGHHAKRVLVVISDGQDNSSRTTFNELRQKVKESDVLIYTICLVDHNNSAFLNAGGQAILDELAAQTGGVALFPNGDKELILAAERIAIELRHQYVVGFVPGNDGGDADKPKWRRVRIKVTPPNREVKNVSVRAREGYFFPRAAP